MECYRLNYVLHKLYVEALIPNMTIFGDWTFKEVVMVNEVIRMDMLMIGVLLRNGKHIMRCTCTHREKKL